MSEKYDQYLEEHISNVLKSFKVLWEVLTPEWFQEKGLDLTLINYTLTEHDRSKYDSHEYEAYDNYFYPEENEPQDKELVDRQFDYAWLRHIYLNPHHWQHWILRKDDGSTTALDMPPLYILEMICDWMSFSVKRNSPFEFVNFYNENVDNNRIELSENTKALVDEIIDRYTIYLEMHPDIFEKILS